MTEKANDYEEKRRKYFELLEAFKMGSMTLEQYEVRLKKVQQPRTTVYLLAYINHILVALKHLSTIESS
ncbi:unnamed protein product [Rotaria socialis]